MSGGGEPEDVFARAGRDVRPGHPRRSRQWALAGLGTALLLGGLVIATAGTSVPAGGRGGQASMTMPGMEHLALSMRSIDGREVEIPCGRPGALLLILTSGCPQCSSTAGALAGLATAIEDFDTTVVGLDPIASRGDFERFDSEAGELDATYVLDDRSRSIAKGVNAFEAGSVVVYDRAGMVVERLDRRQAADSKLLQRAVSAAGR